MNYFSRTNHRQTCLVLVFVIPFIICSCWIFSVFLADDIFGTINSFFLMYPGSDLIWVGYGAYGSSEYGTKVYIYWTLDNVETVNEYYGDQPNIEVFEASGTNIENMWICTWAGFYSYKEDSGCNIVKSKTPASGTIIEYFHPYFAG